MALLAEPGAERPQVERNIVKFVRMSVTRSPHVSSFRCKGHGCASERGRRGGDRAAMHPGERRDEDWPGFLSPGGNDQQFQGLLPRAARARRITGPSPD